MDLKSILNDSPASDFAATRTDHDATVPQSTIRTRSFQGDSPYLRRRPLLNLHNSHPVLPRPCPPPPAPTPIDSCSTPLTPDSIDSRSPLTPAPINSRSPLTSVLTESPVNCNTICLKPATLIPANEHGETLSQKERRISACNMPPSPAPWSSGSLVSPSSLLPSIAINDGIPCSRCRRLPECINNLYKKFPEPSEIRDEAERQFELYQDPEVYTCLSRFVFQRALGLLVLARIQKIRAKAGLWILRGSLRALESQTKPNSLVSSWIEALKFPALEGDDVHCARSEVEEGKTSTISELRRWVCMGVVVTCC